MPVWNDLVIVAAKMRGGALFAPLLELIVLLFGMLAYIFRCDDVLGVLEVAAFGPHTPQIKEHLNSARLLGGIGYAVSQGLDFALYEVFDHIRPLLF